MCKALEHIGTSRVSGGGFGSTSDWRTELSVKRRCFHVRDGLRIGEGPANHAVHDPGPPHQSLEHVLFSPISPSPQLVVLLLMPKKDFVIKTWSTAWLLQWPSRNIIWCYKYQ